MPAHISTILQPARKTRAQVFQSQRRSDLCDEVNSAGKHQPYNPVVYPLYVNKDCCECYKIHFPPSPASEISPPNMLPPSPPSPASGIRGFVSGKKLFLPHFAHYHPHSPQFHIVTQIINYDHLSPPSDTVTLIKLTVTYFDANHNWVPLKMEKICRGTPPPLYPQSLSLCELEGVGHPVFT